MDCLTTDAVLPKLCEGDSLFKLLEEYIRFCHNGKHQDVDPNSVMEPTNKKEVRSKAKPLFPNLAGFCRFLGVGVEEFQELCKDNPQLPDKILAVLEDEALNSELSATLISAYLKKRIGYECLQKYSSPTQSQLQIKFEHNIFEDGE